MSTAKRTKRSKPTKQLASAQIAARKVRAFFNQWAKARVASFIGLYWPDDDDEALLRASNDVFEAVLREVLAGRPESDFSDSLRHECWRDAGYLLGVQVGLRMQALTAPTIHN